MALGFKRKFRALGGKIISHISYDWDETSFENTFEQLRLAGAEYGFIPSYSMQSWEILDNLKSEGVKTNFVGTQLWDSPDFLKPYQTRNLRDNIIIRYFLRTHLSKKFKL